MKFLVLHKWYQYDYVISIKMDKFTTDIFDYFSTCEDKNKLIALIIRDIYLNDLIYIDIVDKWKEYQCKPKSWVDFNMDFDTKIEKIAFVFDQIIDKLAHYESETKKSIMADILETYKFIYQKKYNTNSIQMHCKTLFNVNI